MLYLCFIYVNFKISFKKKKSVTKLLCLISLGTLEQQQKYAAFLHIYYVTLEIIKFQFSANEFCSSIYEYKQTKKHKQHKKHRKKKLHKGTIEAHKLKIQEVIIIIIPLQSKKSAFSNGKVGEFSPKWFWSFQHISPHHAIQKRCAIYQMKHKL